MPRKKPPLESLQALSREASLLSGIQMLLEWDQETFLPEQAQSIRSEQLSLLATLAHKKKTSSSYKRLLSQVVDLPSGKILIEPHLLSPQITAMIREWRREWLHVSKLPSSLVSALTKASSASIPAWTHAKKTGDFRSFAPHLEKVLSLVRKQADLLGYKEHPYEALLELYEPGLSLGSLNALFAEVSPFLTNLIQKTAGDNSPPPWEGPFETTLQMNLAKELLALLGLSSSASRLDLSEHPFCTSSHPSDVRMTTKVHSNDFLPSLFSVLHEGGHALYHSHLPEEFFGTPLHEAASYGVDESQSRFFETILGSSLPFWRYLHSRLLSLFPKQLEGISLETMYRYVNRVQPSCIRIDADEVTYCLHIILRFTLEKDLIAGNLLVKDLPDAWNQKMQELLGITPKNDSEGCLQDIHWSMGAIGYFPSYAIGNFLAAQLFASMKKQLPSLDQQIEKGNLQPITSWLREKIHKHGKIIPSNELIFEATGSSLSTKAYQEYLSQKYSRIYSL